MSALVCHNTGKDIGVLDISGNNLRGIPSDVYKLTELRAINLSQNSLKCTSPNDYSGLPKELTRLKKLEVSYLVVNYSKPMSKHCTKTSVRILQTEVIVSVFCR